MSSNGPVTVWPVRAGICQKACSVRDTRGVISIVVIWVMVILMVIAVGLGRRAAIDIALARYSVGKVKSKHLAESGVMYALALLQKKTEGPAQSDANCVSFSRCGVLIPEGKTPEDIFHEKKLGEGHFDIYYSVADTEGRPVKRYGLEDESGRININAISAVDSTAGRVFRELLSMLDFEDAADTIVRSVAEWRIPAQPGDQGSVASSSGDYVKHAAFESPEELMMIKGMTPKIFSRIKPFITVFPSGESLAINWRIAPGMVLQALTQVVARDFSKVTDWKTLSRSLVEKIVEYRLKKDVELSAPNTPLPTPQQEASGVQALLAPDEAAVWLTMLTNGIKASSTVQFSGIHSRGVDDASGVSTDIEAVYDRARGSIVQWRRDQFSGDRL